MTSIMGNAVDPKGVIISHKWTTKIVQQNLLNSNFVHAVDYQPTVPKCAYYSYSSSKFLVYKECLAELLGLCSQCRLSCALYWTVVGTFVSVTRECSSCMEKGKWCSQPFVNDIPTGNLNLSATVYFLAHHSTRHNECSLHSACLALAV